MKIPEKHVGGTCCLLLKEGQKVAHMHVITEVMSVHPSSLQNFQTYPKVGVLYLTEDACLKTSHSIFVITGWEKKFTPTASATLRMTLDAGIEPLKK